MKVSKGIYLAPEVQYELKKIACTYHITLKSLVPVLLLHIVSNKDSNYFSNLQNIPGPRKLKNIVIEKVVYDNIKLAAYEKHMKLNDFINSALLTTIRYYNIDVLIGNNIYSLKQIK